MIIYMIIIFKIQLFKADKYLIILKPMREQAHFVHVD